ncbi:MAG: hypothetical protein ACOYEW_04055 [Anaerolineae bacterium]|jgi:hypothetical protein
MPRSPVGAPGDHARASGPLTVAVFAVTFALLALLSGPGLAQESPPALSPMAESPLPTPTSTPTPSATPSPTPDWAATAQAATAQARAEVVSLALTAQVEATREAAYYRASTAQAEATARAAERAAETAAAQAEQTAMAEATMPTATPEPEAVALAEPVPEPEPTVAPAPPPPAVHPHVPRLVLASYLAWYDGDGWDGCNISNGDRPVEPYHSDDPAAIGRHVRMALDAGLDGFLLHWFAPGDRTDANMARLLEQSQGTGFQSSVVFLRHIWHGSPAPTIDNVAEALGHILANYGGHPNFLRLDGKPVIFFSDMYRVPGGLGPQAAWQEIRNRVDPNHDTWWIAEGLDPSYLSVFDGLYVYKITHASDPACYEKAGRWADSVRQAEASSGQPKLWVGTIAPGYDDRRAGCRADVRVPSGAVYRDREGGAFYRATYDAAVGSGPDWLLVQSFNEWVEGTYIEPSAQHGDLYLQLTRELAQAFKSGG